MAHTLTPSARSSGMHVGSDAPHGPYFRVSLSKNMHHCDDITFESPRHGKKRNPAFSANRCGMDTVSFRHFEADAVRTQLVNAAVYGGAISVFDGSNSSVSVPAVPDRIPEPRSPPAVPVDPPATNLENAS